MHDFRSHTCNDLRADHVGQTARLSGWVHRKREHANALFIDLRDHYGLTQVVVYPNVDFYEAAKRVPAESVITVTGEVLARDADAKNAEIATGDIELRVAEFVIESQADPLPLPVFGEPDYPEDIRLTHRYLDLRRETLHKNILLRGQVINSLRSRMIDQGFTEFQTPILTASSPEGARDFLVPSRLNPGKFYALPQAPQQFKQLIMVAGFDRYFQIAPCFRDEDARADRSPGEFYQLDIEMSFVTQEDVFNAIEPVMAGVFEEFADGRTVETPFPRIPYLEAMDKYGSDKPDLRNPILLKDVSAFFTDESKTGFGIFAKITKGGGKVIAIPAPGATDSQSRKFFDEMDKWAKKEMQAPGLGYARLRAGEGEEVGTVVSQDPALKNFDPEHLKALLAEMGLGAGDGVFFSAGKKSDAYKLAGAARDRVGANLGLIEEGIFKFCWIVDFPMYEWDEDNKKVEFSHNPFSMPQGGMAALEAADTAEKQLDLLAYQYDIVCNGVELSSGAIRNHKPDVMYKAFELAGYDKSVVDTEFAGMINAFKYGAPPHGGIAPGVDRIVMLLAGTNTIRDVILFPMNGQAQDLMMNAPAEVDSAQLKELHLKLVPVEKD
ncbi:aspartate--tRNA(Asp/Asn) ligase [Algimonas ampicilliniresistens]|uniref:Aspartate--tRNA(Asp/Asn) ligase n=1 Tax=Algimonas ampicilliniresistens TaxID=1298735 RepID=A0ABQ5VDS9_9PROT|nr:aspartate--tRNA ligase [Algimonas ampicilliniresistens]GLQ24860.1 aspartate--tRNA(Asp/Asn) ligase [Algimonas ampicilliniresistens]